MLVWFATEGHVNGRNGGVVITQADRDELERVRAAYARITTGTGSIDAGAKTDSAWRLYLGSQAIVRLCVHHCGELSVNKRLPDFLFRLPTAYLQHAFDELMRTDGSRKMWRRCLKTPPRRIIAGSSSSTRRSRRCSPPRSARWPRCSATITASTRPRATVGRRPIASASSPEPAREAADASPSSPACTNARSPTSGSTTSSAPACTTSSAASATWSRATRTSQNINVCRTTNSWKRCATARSRSTCPT